jgi:hypothetical protein
LFGVALGDPLGVGLGVGLGVAPGEAVWAMAVVVKAMPPINVRMKRRFMGSSGCVGQKPLRRTPTSIHMPSLRRILSRGLSGKRRVVARALRAMSTTDRNGPDHGVASNQMKSDHAPPM